MPNGAGATKFRPIRALRGAADKFPRRPYWRRNSVRLGGFRRQFQAGGGGRPRSSWLQSLCASPHHRERASAAWCPCSRAGMEPLWVWRVGTARRMYMFVATSGLHLQLASPNSACAGSSGRHHMVYLFLSVCQLPTLRLDAYLDSIPRSSNKIRMAQTSLAPPHSAPSVAVVLSQRGGRKQVECGMFVDARSGMTPLSLCMSRNYLPTGGHTGVTCLDVQAHHVRAGLACEWSRRLASSYMGSRVPSDVSRSNSCGLGDEVAMAVELAMDSLRLRFACRWQVGKRLVSCQW